MTRSLLSLLFILSSALTLQRISHYQDPLAFGVSAYHNLASSIGITLAVPENQYNALAEQLKSKEQELKERERMLSQGGSGFRFGDVARKDMTLLLLLMVNLILFLGLVLHLYSDYRHGKTGRFSLS